MILHCMHHEKFTKPYIDFINNHFNSDDHLFLLQASNESVNVYEGYKNVEFINIGKKHPGSPIKYKKYFKSADKIILHSLFNDWLVLSLYLFPKYLSKSYWVLWGGDLYNRYWKRKSSLKLKVKEHFRKKVIKNMGNVITHIKGDFYKTKEWYNTDASYFYCFVYPSNLFKPLNINDLSSNSETVNILLGNSAAKTNNHQEIFQKLKEVNNIKVHVPLSYGDDAYRNHIIKEGQKILGNRFSPLIEFMKLANYNKFLTNIDVAIFNHKRQQALGNIITLLGMGKKVFIREEITTYEFLYDLGITFYSIEYDFLDKIFEDQPLLQNNIDIIKREFSVERLIKDWNTIFES